MSSPYVHNTMAVEDLFETYTMSFGRMFMAIYPYKCSCFSANFSLHNSQLEGELW